MNVSLPAGLFQLGRRPGSRAATGASSCETWKEVRNTSKLLNKRLRDHYFFSKDENPLEHWVVNHPRVQTNEYILEETNTECVCMMFCHFPRQIFFLKKLHFCLTMASSPRMCTPTDSGSAGPRSPSCIASRTRRRRPRTSCGCSSRPPS